MHVLVPKSLLYCSGPPEVAVTSLILAAVDGIFFCAIMISAARQRIMTCKISRKEKSAELDRETNCTIIAFVELPLTYLKNGGALLGSDPMLIPSYLSYRRTFELALIRRTSQPKYFPQHLQRKTRCVSYLQTCCQRTLRARPMMLLVFFCCRICDLVWTSRLGKRREGCLYFL